jgi:dTDP-4-dehydrorhamnose 3,5-epimerase
VIFRSSPIFPEVIIIELEVFEDQRGWFTEMYRSDKFETAGIRGDFVQDNLSRSRRGTVRGLHYQVKKPQGKLVWALSGKIYDVVVDIRSNSPTFKKWFGIILSDENKTGLYIPPNFAHGYAALSEEVTFFTSARISMPPVWNDASAGMTLNWGLSGP